MSSQNSSQPDSAPKDDYIPKKKAGNAHARHRKQEQWICMIPESFSYLCGKESAEKDRVCSIVSLKDPNTDVSRRYLFKETPSESHSGEICEILKFSEEPRSWFVGNAIHTDGSFFICTPMDPLFLALPYFQASAKTGKYTTLDVILEDVLDYNTFRVLSSCVHPTQWANISYLKTVGGSAVYRLSKEKTLAWLQKKVSTLAVKLEKENVYVGSGSISSTMTDSNQLEATKSMDSYCNYACGMISDYLNAELTQDLFNIYNVEKTNGKLTSEEPLENVSVEPRTKRSCLCNRSEPLEDYSTNSRSLPPPLKVAELTASQKSLAKIDKKGMKTLSSFFKKK